MAHVLVHCRSILMTSDAASSISSNGRQNQHRGLALYKTSCLTFMHGSSMFSQVSGTEGQAGVLASTIEEHAFGNSKLRFVNIISKT